MDNKKLMQSKIFGFIAMGFAIISIPMYFLPLLSASIFGFDAGINLIDLFDISGVSMFDEGTGLLKAFCAVIIADMVLSLATAIFAIFAKKGLRITATITSAIAFIANVVIIVITFVKGESIVKPGIGLWLAMAFSLIAFVLILVAAIVMPKNTPQNDAMPLPPTPNGSGIIQYKDGDTVILNGSITFLSGNCAGYQIPISGGEEIIIGKDPSMCAIVIDKKYTKVSRKHCGVRYDANQDIYIVTDYSTNGTNIVGGPKLARNTASFLSHGTTINLANSENSFRLD